VQIAIMQGAAITDPTTSKIVARTYPASPHPSSYLRMSAGIPSDAARVG
jgi:hypothetical protein